MIDILIILGAILGISCCVGLIVVIVTTSEINRQSEKHKDNEEI